MPRKPNVKLDWTNPTYLENKAKRDKKKQEKLQRLEQEKLNQLEQADKADESTQPKPKGFGSQSKATKPKQAKADDPILEWPIDPQLERQYNSPDNLHVDQNDPQGKETMKNWSLSSVPYIIIGTLVLVFRREAVLNKEKYSDFVNKPHNKMINYLNVGSLRIVVHLFAMAHPEILINLDLQFYVNMLQRYSSRILKRLPQLFETKMETQETFMYNGIPMKADDIRRIVIDYCIKDNNGSFLYAIFGEFRGRNWIKQRYYSIKVDFAWTLDMTQFFFQQSQTRIWALVILDFASRKVKGHHLFNHDPTSEEVFTTVKSTIAESGNIPDILHSDCGGNLRDSFDKMVMKEFPSIRISKAIKEETYGDFNNQVMEAFFSSFKIYFYNQYDEGFFNEAPAPKLYSAITTQLKSMNEDKVHPVLMQTPSRDYMNKSVLELLFAAYPIPEEDALPPTQAEKILRPESVPVEVVSYEETANNDEKVIYLGADGQLIENQIALQHYSESHFPKRFYKLMVEQIPESSETIISRLLQADFRDKIVQQAVKHLPQNFLEIEASDNAVEKANQKEANNAFFYAAKDTIIQECPNSTLASFVSDNMPDLIKGPGRDKNYNDNFYKYMDLQIHLNAIIHHLLSLFYIFRQRLVFVLISRHAERNHNMQMMEHRRTQSLIEEKYKDVSRDLEFTKQEVSRLTADLDRKMQEEARKEEARQRRKSYNRLPIREPINDSEFIAALMHCQKIFDNGKYPEAYTASLYKISFFLLQCSGMRVSNLLHLTFQDVHNVFNDSSYKVMIPLIKSSARRELFITVDHRLRKMFFQSAPYKLASNFGFMIDRIQKWNKEQPNQLNFSQLMKLPFACSFGNPEKAMSREHLTRSLNKLLEAINVDQNGTPKNKNPKTTHCFRINVITNITANQGIHAAKDFVQHDDIKSTDRYQRTKLSDKERANLTYFLVAPQEKQRKGSPEKATEDPDKLKQVLDEYGDEIQRLGSERAESDWTQSDAQTQDAVSQPSEFVPSQSDSN